MLATPNTSQIVRLSTTASALITYFSICELLSCDRWILHRNVYQPSGVQAMVTKNYKKRIDDGLAGLRTDKHLDRKQYGPDTPAAKIGDLFQIVADLTEDFEEGLQLFRDADLSPQNPFHFLYLVDMLAGVHYYDGKKGHPPTRAKFGAHLQQQLQAIADEHKEYRIVPLAELYIRECRNPIPSLKKIKGVVSAMRGCGIKIIKPQRERAAQQKRPMRRGGKASR
jgi:hypothetical protein